MYNHARERKVPKRATDSEREKRGYAGVKKHYVVADGLIGDVARSTTQTLPPSLDPKAKKKRKEKRGSDRNGERGLTFRGLKGGTAEEFAGRAPTRGPASGTRRSEGEALLCTR